MMVGRFVEVCKRRGLKVNADKRKAMVLGGEEGLECEIRVDGVRLEQVSDFKYLKCVLDESGTDVAECRRKLTSGRKVAGAIRSLVNAKGLQPECERLLHEGLLVPVLLYGSETIIWRENDRSRIIAEHMDNLEGFLGIKRMDKVPNTQIREMCGVTKGVDEIDEGVLWWFGLAKRIENDRITKRAYVEKRVASLSIGWPSKRWIDTVRTV